MMNSYDVIVIRHISKYVIFYIIGAILLYCIFPAYIPNGVYVLIQFLLLLLSSCFICTGLKLTIGVNISILLFYQLLLTLSLHFYFVYVEYLPFGFNPIDAITYLNITKFSMEHSFVDFLSYMEAGGQELSDYGFPTIMHFVYKWAGNIDAGITCMCVINSFSIVLGAWGLYKLSLFFLNGQWAKLIALFWGLNSCSIWSNVCGLKESIFTTLLIYTMYYMYKFWMGNKHTFLSLFLFLFFLALTVFFRFYLSIFFVLLFLFKFVYTSCLARLMPVIMLALTILSAFTTYFLSTNLPILDMILLNQEEKATGLPMILANMIVGFIGPLPNYFQHDNPEALMYAPYSAFMVFFGLYAILGGYYIFKNKVLNMYPLLLFVFFNILLVVSTIHSFDYRFSYTMVPFYFILVVYGICHSAELHVHRVLHCAYYLFCFLLVFWYNIR